MDRYMHTYIHPYVHVRGSVFMFPPQWCGLPPPYSLPISCYLHFGATTSQPGPSCLNTLKQYLPLHYLAKYRSSTYVPCIHTYILPIYYLHASHILPTYNPAYKTQTISLYYLRTMYVPGLAFYKT